MNRHIVIKIGLVVWTCCALRTAALINRFSVFTKHTRTHTVKWEQENRNRINNWYRIISKMRFYRVVVSCLWFSISFWYPKTDQIRISRLGEIVDMVSAKVDIASNQCYNETEMTTQQEKKDKLVQKEEKEDETRKIICRSLLELISFWCVRVFFFNSKISPSHMYIYISYIFFSHFNTDSIRSRISHSFSFSPLCDYFARHTYAISFSLILCSHHGESF